MLEEGQQAPTGACLEGTWSLGVAIDERRGKQMPADGGRVQLRCPPCLRKKAVHLQPLVLSRHPRIDDRICRSGLGPSSIAEAAVATPATSIVGVRRNSSQLCLFLLQPADPPSVLLLPYFLEREDASQRWRHRGPWPRPPPRNLRRCLASCRSRLNRQQGPPSADSLQHQKQQQQQVPFQRPALRPCYRRTTP